MSKHRENLRTRPLSESESSLLALYDEYESVIHRVGYSLLVVHQMVMTRVCNADDMKVAEELNDQLKPLIDELLHYAVPRG